MAAWLCVLVACSFDPSVNATAPPATEPVFGDGGDGAYTAAGEDEIVNAYTPLRAAASAGSRTLAVEDASIVGPGDLVVVWQTAAVLGSVPAGDPGPVQLAGLGVGQFEIASVESAAGGEIIVVTGLANAYSVPGAQVVRGPQLTELVVPADTEILAEPWNGETGGMIAVFASQRVHNDGVIRATADGSRPGQYRLDNPFMNACAAIDEPPPGGAERGEGIALDAYRLRSTGYGNSYSGGGGGNCADSGGGGGGHAEVGGGGGDTWSGDGSREVGGLGGASLSYALDQRLAFGGGGGAGSGDGPDDDSRGGRGGGVIVVFSPVMTGTGRYAARGASGGDSVDSNGAGGGGAGGAVWLFASDSITCDEVDVVGGDGGDTDGGEHGPGGGGAPGFVRIDAPAVNCAIDQRYGVAGVEATGTPWGATPACGDLEVFGDEQCDDGNRSSGDGCSADCLSE